MNMAECGYQSTELIDVHLDYNDLKSRDTRCVLFQLLYAYDARGYAYPLPRLVDDFNEAFGLSIPMASESMALLQDVTEHQTELDSLIQPLLTRWKLDRVGVCTKLILRIALWELRTSSLDAALLINESIELAKCFGEHESYKFVNGILDRYVKEQKNNEEASPLSDILQDTKIPCQLENPPSTEVIKHAGQLV